MTLEEALIYLKRQENKKIDVVVDGYFVKDLIGWLKTLDNLQKNEYNKRQY